MPCAPEDLGVEKSASSWPALVLIHELVTHNPYDLLGGICWPGRLAAQRELQLRLAALWGLGLFAARWLILSSTLALHHLVCVSLSNFTSWR